MIKRLVSAQIASPGLCMHQRLAVKDAAGHSLRGNVLHCGSKLCFLESNAPAAYATFMVEYRCSFTPVVIEHVQASEE